MILLRILLLLSISIFSRAEDEDCEGGSSWSAWVLEGDCACTQMRTRACQGHGCIGAHKEIIPCSTAKEGELSGSTPLQYIWVAGGSTTDRSDFTPTVEVIPLSGQLQKRCPNGFDIQPLPKEAAASSVLAAKVNGRPVACCKNGCWAYKLEVNSWDRFADMPEGLFHEEFGEIVQLNESDFWIFGYSGSRNPPISKIYRGNFGQWEDGPQLPGHLVFLCHARLDDNNILFQSKHAGFLQYNQAEGTFTKLPNSTHRREGHSCGMVKVLPSEDGATAMRELMTTSGGERTANKYPGEIYNFEGSVWRDVPTAERLPLGLLHAMKVQLEDTFLLVGGVESVKMCSDLTGQCDHEWSPMLSTIYEFDPLRRRWELRPQRLKIGRFFSTPLLMEGADILKRCI